MSSEEQPKRLTREEELELWRASRGKAVKQQPEKPKATNSLRSPTPARRALFPHAPAALSSSFSSYDSGSSHPDSSISSTSSRRMRYSTTEPRRFTRSNSPGRSSLVPKPDPTASPSLVSRSTLAETPTQAPKQVKPKRTTERPPLPPTPPSNNTSPEPVPPTLQAEPIPVVVPTLPPIIQHEISCQTDAVVVTCEMEIQASLGGDVSVEQMKEIVTMAKEDIAAMRFVNAVLEQRVQELETQTTRDQIDYDSCVEDIRDKYRKELKKVTQEKQTIQRKTEEMVSQMQQQLTEGLDMALKRIQELEDELQREKALRKNTEREYQLAVAALARAHEEAENEENEEDEEEEEEIGDEDEHEEGDDEEEEEEENVEEDGDAMPAANMKELREEIQRQQEWLDAHKNAAELSAAELNASAANDEDGSEENSTECGSSESGDTDKHANDEDREQIGTAESLFGDEANVSPIKMTGPQVEVESPEFGAVKRWGRRSTILPSARRSESPEQPLDTATIALSEPDLEQRAETFTSVLDMDDDGSDDDLEFGDEDEEPNMMRRRRRQSSMWDFKGRKSMQGYEDEDIRERSTAHL